MIQSPDGPILLFSLCPFSPFPVSPSSLFPFLSCPSAPWLLPPRPPSRGRPPLPGDCTPWPLGRRGRSSCKGTLQSNAPPSTARPGLPIDDCRLTIAQGRGPGLGARASGFGSRGLSIADCRWMLARESPRRNSEFGIWDREPLSPVTRPLFPVWLLTSVSPPAYRTPSPESRNPQLLPCAFSPLPSAFWLRPSASPPSPSSAPPGIWPTAADR